jgi:hypothetical protein
MVGTMSIPFFKCFEAANAVGAAPSLFRRKGFKAVGKMLLARNTELVLLFTTTVPALVAMWRYVMAKESFLGIIYALFRWTERAGRYLLALALFQLVAF